VGDQQANAVGMAVRSHAVSRDILERNLERQAGRGNFECHHGLATRALMATGRPSVNA
jgi:hypothetical protein